MEQPSEYIPEDGGPDARAVCRQIRRFTRGVFRVDDETWPALFVVDGRDGSVVFPCDAENAGSGVLYAPDDGFDELAILVETEVFTPRFDEVKDRHQAYHGRADGRDWLRGIVDSVKWKGRVFPGAEVVGPNPLRSVEPGLCMTLNSDRDRLAEVTRLLTGFKPESAVCVGVDPLGMDVRARAGVIRVEWPREIESPEQAHAVVGALLADGIGQAD